MDFKNLRMIKYWYILFLICETVFIQALKHSHLLRIISGFLALCTVRCTVGATITYVYINSSANKFDNLQCHTWYIHNKIFRVALIFFSARSRNWEKCLVASSLFFSVRPSAWHKSASTGRIFIKCVILVFLEYLSRKFKFHENPTTIMTALHEDQYTFFYGLVRLFL